MRTKSHRPFLKFLRLLIVVWFWCQFPKLIYSDLIVPDLDPSYSYVGCYHEQIEVLTNSMFAGNVQTCIGICEKGNFRYAVLSRDKCFCVNEVDESQKLDSQMCNILCSKNKAQYCGGVGTLSYYTTLVMDPPRNLKIVNRTETSIFLQWNPNEKTDLVTYFKIKSYVIKSFATYSFFLQPEWIVQNTESRFEMTNLHPGTTYNITIVAMCENKSCGDKYIIGDTVIGLPDPPPKEPKIIDRTDNRITVEIEQGFNNNGPITFYRLIVQRVDDSLIQSFDENLLGDYHHAFDDGTPYYITAEFEYKNQTQQFVIGDSKTYRGYFNAPISVDDHVHILLGLISSLNGTTKARYTEATHDQHNPNGFIFADFESGEASILALTIACVVFGILLVLSIVAYFYLRYKTGNRRHRLSDAHELTMQGPTIEVENNGFVRDEYSKGFDFMSELNGIVDNLDASQKFSRNAIRLNINNVIANGTFGEVLTGQLYTVGDALNCQVHVVNDDMEYHDQSSFLQDFEQIVQIMPHDKFLKFFGVSASPDWFYIIFENPPDNLKMRLVNSRLQPNHNPNRFSSISEECILQWVYDICVAMEYLEVNQVIHKHLCSYNVYVTQTNEIKISQFGPTPNLNQIETGQMVDISRWLSPEVLLFQHHSNKADVWSFACLAWECCNLGATPYANITSQDLVPRIKNGVRPEKTTIIFDDLYQLFLNCWQLEPSERPDFEEICFNIKLLLTSPRHVISFDRRENTLLPYYLPLLELQY